MKKRLCIALLIPVLIAALPVGLRSDETGASTVVEVTGTGTIVGGNESRARNEAISNGLVSAVERVLPDLISSQEMVRNFQAVNMVIYDRINDYIGDYKVLTEIRHDKYYRIILRTTVMVDKMKQQLSVSGVLSDKKVLPRVLFFLSEQNLGDPFPQCWWANDEVTVQTVSGGTIAEMMRRRDFELIDPEVFRKDQVLKNKTLQPEITLEDAVRIGSHMQADLVIIGKAVVRPVSSRMEGGIRSFNGVVEVEVFRTDTGLKIASAMQNTSVLNVSEIEGGRAALAQAGTLAGEELISVITTSWRKEDEQPALLEVVISGTDYLADFVKLRRALNEMSGIKGIQTREMQSDRAVILVDSSGNGWDLANALMLKTFDTFAINISEVTSTRLKLGFMPVRKPE